MVFRKSRAKRETAGKQRAEKGPVSGSSSAWRSDTRPTA